jgi:hypothetical protein
VEPDAVMRLQRHFTPLPIPSRDAHISLTTNEHVSATGPVIHTGNCGTYARGSLERYISAHSTPGRVSHPTIDRYPPTNHIVLPSVLSVVYGGRRAWRTLNRGVSVDGGSDGGTWTG